MAELYVNVNGTWKTASNYYVNVNGTWKEGSELHAKVSSAWKQSSSSSSIITTNLILHLDAGNSSSYGGSGTTWSNLVSSSYDATLVNGVGYSSSDGGSLVFDGTNDHATISSGSGLGAFSGDFTIEFWFKGDDQTAYAFFLEYYLNVSTPIRWGISAFTDSTNMTWWRDGSVRFTTSGVDVFDNAWHHHALVRNGSSINYYIDTVSRGSETYSGTLSSGNSLMIGRYNSGNYWIDGNLAQIRIYSGTGLTSSQVTQNYNATKATFGY